ncbi:MAG: histidinol-phosphate transaminase [Flavobacteriales bacterium]|nr:histidinol-phosphate transaminase [Flavobacteriales bacterium]MCB9363429.1 histidinol-phosphate transaminase [Flavobacteriales bacterium]
MDINKLVRKNVVAMKPYSSARDEFDGEEGLFLDANENPYSNGVNRYPDPYQRKLKAVIATQKQVSIENILLGNGSDEVLDLLFRAFCEPKKDNVVVTAPSYGMYKVLANLNDVEVNEVFYESDFSLDADKIIAATDKNTKLIILCSPNNPTGNSIGLKVIEKVLKNTNCLVVVDEAYIDFSNKSSCIKSLGSYNQLIVIQTLSKYFGMAGIRLGMCFASKEMITILNRIKPPYNVNVLTQTKAIELLQNIDLNYKNEVISERENLSKELSKLNYVVKVYPSDANFLLVKTTDANWVYNELVKQQIIIRNRTNEPLCKDCVRISIGTKQENEILIKAMLSLRM